MSPTPPLVIGIAGGSGAGKTTLARRLFDSVGEEKAVYLSHDCYYKCLEHLPVEKREKNNFDHPNSLDTALLVQHIRQLKDNKPICLPTYDFSTHCRTDKTTIVQPKRIVIVEGILIFCDQELVNEFDIKIFVDASSDVRLSRRITRDCTERGRDMHSVLGQYEATVRPMHMEWVEPSKANADIIVTNSSNQDTMKPALEMLVNHTKVMAGMI